MAQYWLKTFLEKHDSLCQVADNLPLPTRVLDVGLQESDLATLYIPNGQHGQWLTLSHCWGSSHPATTTISNLESQCTGIMISTLPQTFQDAIYITRRLGYRFLWIDSLCILQDSAIDWQEESVKMNTIYSNAVLNISADAAADSSEGMFDSSKKMTSQSDPRYMSSKPSLVQIPVHSPKTSLKSTLYIYHEKKEVFAYKQPLQRRGWVLAEAVLSHRRLRYTSSGLSWSCARVPTSCNETRPHEIHNLVEQKFSINSVYQILNKADVYEMDNDAKHIDIIPWWYNQLNDYTDRHLTFAHDQFPAFSGIAKMFCDLTQWHYKAGILVEDFRRGLLWQSRGRGMHPEVAPSWSWAALRHAENDYGCIYHFNYGSITSTNDPQLVQLIHISVTNVGDDPFGQVISGSLTLQGFCHLLNNLLKVSDFYFQSGWYAGIADTRDQNYQTFSGHRLPPPEALRLHMDVMDETKILFWHREDIFMLRIGMFAPITDPFPYPPEATWFLIIQEIPRLEGAYRRIGVASIPGKGIESPDWKMKTVTIL